MTALLSGLIPGLTSWSLTLLHLVPAADPVPDDSEVQPGPWMAVVILLLIAASVFLWFSMRKQMGRIRVPRRDEPDAPGHSEDGAADTDRGATSETADNDRPADPPLS